MGIGLILFDICVPFLEFIAPAMPGKYFPSFFNGVIPGLQRALIASIMVTIVAGFLGTFLLVRNLALIGDGLAHVSFGGVAIGIVLGATSPLWYALMFSIIASILIYELQSREILTGDSSIAIFMTGMLALGLVCLRISGRGITTEIHSYLFGSQLLIDKASLDQISFICIGAIILLFFIRNGLLAITIDPLAARVQGLPVQGLGLLFSIITAAVVVSMVKIVGALLVTALLVTPAASAQLIGRSFKSCLVWTQILGISSVIIGLYLSAEYDAGPGSGIALVAASIFAIVATCQILIRTLINPNGNSN